MAFDQKQTIISGPPNFHLLWSSTPTSSGHYVCAFANGNLGSPNVPANASDLIPLIGRINMVFNLGFVVAGQSPASASPQQLLDFANSVLQIASKYPAHVTGGTLGGMILWLPAFGAVDRSSAFGLFLPGNNTAGPWVYGLDQTTHRIFGAGGGNRSLYANPSGIAANLGTSGPMTVVVQSTAGPLPVSFGPTPYYQGVAVSSQVLTIPLDTSQANNTAGCIVFGGSAGPGLRNFELGFEHGFAPQGGLGADGTAKPFHIFHPLLDRTETLQGATVSAALNPLIPTTAAYNTLQISRSTPFVSAYRTRMGDKVTLAPAAGAQFQATPCQTTRSYFAPAGTFTLGVQNQSSSLYSVIGGLSSVEYLEFASGDSLTFVAAQNAAIAFTTVTNPDGTTYTTFAPAAPDGSSAVSWAQLTPAGARNYVCESDVAPMFTAPQPTVAPLDFKPVPLRQLASGAASPKLPLLPYAAVDFGTATAAGNAGATAGMTAAFEHSFVASARLQQLESGTPIANSDGVVLAVTPQGYIVEFNNGAMTSITLGTIDGAADSSAALSFVGSAQYPLTQNFTNAFLANQQFIVATCLTADLQNRYNASANLSGWTFDVSLPSPKDVVPGAYQTVLIIKSAVGSIKSFAAEPYAWTAYSTFNNNSDDAVGQMLSSWLVAYLAQAEALYDNGNGLTGLQTFVDLINDPDWNGFIYLHVPIQIGDLDPSIEFLTAGIDPSQFFAHHVGCAVNHTQVASGAYQSNSSYIGLVHYLRPGTDPGDLTGTPPFVPQSVNYDFQLLTLEARFENSVLIDFRSSAQLLLSELFGDSVLPSSPDPNVSATDALMIYGSMQSAGGVPHYVFATAKGASSTFFLSSAALERIEIDRAIVQVGTAVDAQGFRTAAFQMSGWFGLLPAASFDVLSYAAIPFDRLELDMRFQTGQPSTYSLLTDNVTLTQMPARVADTGEIITAAKAAANIIYRQQSLASGFPLAVTRLMTVTDASQTPSSLGYRNLTTQVSLGTPSLAGGWYGLEFDLPLGSGGALSGGALFTAKMLFAWAPGGSGQIAIQPGFMLQGPGGANLTLEIEGVLKLGAAGIFLSQNKAGQFVLQLASLGITILGKSFPPAGTTNLLLAGFVDADQQRHLGWFGAYVEASASGN